MASTTWERAFQVRVRRVGKYLPSALLPWLVAAPQRLGTIFGRGACELGVIRAHPAVAARLFELVPVFDLDTQVSLVEHRIQFEIDVPPTCLGILRR